jgi:hypothetical protein
MKRRNRHCSKPWGSPTFRQEKEEKSHQGDQIGAGRETKVKLGE